MIIFAVFKMDILDFECLGVVSNICDSVTARVLYQTAADQLIESTTSNKVHLRIKSKV